MAWYGDNNYCYSFILLRSRFHQYLNLNSGVQFESVTIGQLHIEMNFRSILYQYWQTTSRYLPHHSRVKVQETGLPTDPALEN